MVELNDLFFLLSGDFVGNATRGCANSMGGEKQRSNVIYQPATCCIHANSVNSLNHKKATSISSII